MKDLTHDLADRLTRYCAIDSQSDADSPSSPSTAIQLDMQRLLVAELTAMGAEDVTLTEYGAVLATIPGTREGPTVGFLAHVDTAPQFNATGVKPRIIRGYNGGAITYPDDPGLSLTPEAFPYLAEKLGHDIVTASGLTLLGADDKAGVAILMTAAERLLADPSLPRPRLRLAFTPDEEIGRGVDARLPQDLGADFAYTFDGGKLGEIEYETFSADGAVVTIKGGVDPPRLCHRQAGQCDPPGGQDHPDPAAGDAHARDDRGTRRLHPCHGYGRRLVRDADQVHPARFRTRGAGGEGRAAAPGLRGGGGDRTPGRDHLHHHPTVPEHALLARIGHDPRGAGPRLARALGLDPVSVPIRGGTDGSRLTEMGIPCPNLFTGMQNIHGPLEWISVQDMEVAMQLCLEIAGRAAKG